MSVMGAYRQVREALDAYKEVRYIYHDDGEDVLTYWTEVEEETE